MNNITVLTPRDQRQIDITIQRIDHMIAAVGDHHEDGDYVGAALDVIAEIQKHLEQRRKEIACE